MLLPDVFLGYVTKDAHADRNSDYVYTLTAGEVYVRNFSFHKCVGVRILDGQTWRDVPFVYSRTLGTSGGNFAELWRLPDSLLLNTSSDRFKPPRTFQFAVYYNNLDWGTWYWDNNGGQDYNV